MSPEKARCEEWIVQGMYANAQSQVRIGEGYSQDLDVKIRVNHYDNQGSVLSPLVFIIVLEALSRFITTGFIICILHPTVQLIP